MNNSVNSSKAVDGMRFFQPTSLFDSRTLENGSFDTVTIKHDQITVDGFRSALSEVINGTTIISDPRDARKIFGIIAIDLESPSQVDLHAPIYKSEVLYKEPRNADLFVSTDRGDPINDMERGWVAMAIRVAQARQQISHEAYSGEMLMVRISPPGVGLGTGYSKEEVKQIITEGIHHYGSESFETNLSLDAALRSNNIHVKNIFGGGENIGFAAALAGCMPKDTIKRVGLYGKPMPTALIDKDFIPPATVNKFTDEIFDATDNYKVLYELLNMNEEYNHSHVFGGDFGVAQVEKMRKCKKLLGELSLSYSQSPDMNLSIFVNGERPKASDKNLSLLKQLASLGIEASIIKSVGSKWTGLNFSSILGFESYMLSVPTRAERWFNEQID